MTDFNYLPMKKLFLFGILVSFCQYTYAQKNFIDQPYVETRGSSDTLVVPDKIHISIELKEADTKNRRSVEDLENAMQSVLTKLNIDLKKDLTLLDASSSFQSYFFRGKTILKSKFYDLVLKDAITTQKVLSGLEYVGISNINITKTEYSKEKELLLLLKTKAILKAKANAESLLKPLHQKAGKILYISDNEMPMYRNLNPETILAKSVDLNNEKIETPPLDINFNKIYYSTSVDTKFSIE